MLYHRPQLLQHIRDQFVIDWHGVHGANHWARVLHHGQRIAEQRQADLLVVELFAFLHDSCRFDDYKDPLHGERGAEFAHGINGQHFHLDSQQLDNLCYAIRHHSGGEVSTNPTIQSCWDADRLDLGRVGIIPSPKFLSAEASQLIDEAFNWSISA